MMNNNMNSRPYKRRYAYAVISGTEPEYKRCKSYVEDHPDKFTYKTADYPCANAGELAEYTRLNTDSQIASCYNQLIGHKITDASRFTKIKLPDGGLMLKVPGYIDNPGQMTGYNVNKDCSITVTTINRANGFILGTQTMSRGQFNSKYKIEEVTPPAPTPTPEPEPDTGTGVGFIDDLMGEITDENGDLTTKGMLLVGGGAAALIVVLFAASKLR